MAMTQLVLLFMATLATLATVGMFIRYSDRWTEMVVTFLAAMLWGVVGLSSFDVHAEAFGNQAEPILPLAYLSFALAGIIGIYALTDFVTNLGKEARDSAFSRL